MPTTYKVNFKTTTLIYKKTDDFLSVFLFAAIGEKITLTFYSLIFLMNHLPTRSISFNASGRSSSGKPGVK